MVDLDFITLIDKLSLLYQKENEKNEILRIERENSFSALCEDLLFLYNEEKSRTYHEYIEPFVYKYSFLKEKSFLGVTEKKLNKEAYHSLFLKYIWNSKTEFGNKIFRRFLEEIGIKDNWLDSLEENLYSVEDEHNTRIQRKKDLHRKRIDLLFVDRRNKWLVVIENKVDSSVHNDKQSNRSQLEIYRDYCECNFKFRDYHKEYILLSYTETNKNHLECGWIYADYHQLFRSLFPFRLNDVFLQDYLKVLFSLLFPEMKWEDDFENMSLYRCMLFYNNVISKIQ